MCDLDGRFVRDDVSRDEDGGGHVVKGNWLQHVGHAW